MNESILHEILILLAAAVIAVALFRRFKMPPILGYLFVGMLVGPYGLQWIPDTQDTRFLAEFGVVFLLFTIGLEFSLPKLLAMKSTVLGLGGAQVTISTVLAGTLAWALGVPWEGALIVGGILALSSTAIVIKQLTEQLEINSRHGHNAVGVLLFQDLAVIPFLILIPILANDSGQWTLAPLLLAMLKGALIFVIMLALGHWLLRPLFREIAAARSAELFVLTVLLVSLTAAWATHLAGLSLALGGFAAGAMLGETEFRHQVEADIRPFRDVLLGLFFITIGMLLNLRDLLDLWPWVLLTLSGFVLVKTVLISLLCRAFGHEPGVSLRTGLVLAQGGEFGFALLSLAMTAHLIEHRTGQIVLAATLLSMALAPFVIRFNGHAAKYLFTKSYMRNRQHLEEDIRLQTTALHDHVVICGYGRIGQNVGHFLEHEGFPYAALDLDPQRVREARAAGESVFYGDATHPGILHAAGIERAQAVVISFDDAHATLKLLARIRDEFPEMPVLVRSRDDSYLEQLQALGATEVVPETLEGSLMLASHLLYLLNVPVSTIVRRVRDVRSDRYRLLRGFFPGEEAIPIEASGQQRERLHAVTLPKGAAAVGRSIAEQSLEDCSVTITAVRHEGVRSVRPTPELILSENDVLVLYGTPQDLERAETRLLKG